VASASRNSLHAHPGSQQADAAEDNAVCLIYSNHPLAFSMIKEAVCTDGRLRIEVKPCYSIDSSLMHGVKNQILILDTCSVENWTASLNRWNLGGGTAIALLSPEMKSREFDLELLYLGTAGVLTLADISAHLPSAIYAVAQGGLWFTRDVLDAYVKQTRIELRRYSSCDQTFTTREQQVVELLLQNQPNRLIAQRFAISERTIKFHVSNILRKLNVKSRNELRHVYSASTILSFRLPSAPENKRRVSLMMCGTRRVHPGR